MDFRSMKRKELQALCKKHNLPANKTNLLMAESLASFLKVEEKPVESSSEVTSVNGSAIAMKRVKKVRFCLEEEKTEIIDLEKETDRKVVRETRRKSILKPQLEIPKLNVEEMENSENQEEERDIPVRVTRSRARKLMEAEVSSNGSPPVKKKKSRASNDSIKNICRSSDKAPTVLSLLVDGVAENTVALENLGPMRRSLRSREIDVYPERKETNRRKTRKAVSEDGSNGDEVEVLGVLMQKSVPKRSKKIVNGDIVAKRNLRSDELKKCVILEEETENGLETEALKPLNTDNSSTGASEQSLAQSTKRVSEEEVSAAKTESVAGVGIQEKNESLLQFAGKKSSVLKSDGENVVNVEGKRMSELPQGRRRSQRRAPKNKSFVPETETTSESKFQIQEENEQVLQVEEPTGDDVPRHESSVLDIKDETVVPSERKVLSKPKDHPRRSRRKAHENKSFAPTKRLVEPDGSCEGNKLGEQLALGEPVLEEEISLPKAAAVDDEEEPRHKKSEDTVDDEENTGSLRSTLRNWVNADVREQNCECNCDEVILTEEKESAVTMVENLSLNEDSDPGKDKTKHADALVEELVDEDGGEAASMMLKEPLEFPGTSEVIEDHDICDTTHLKLKACIPSNLEDEAIVATTEGNFACANEKDLIAVCIPSNLEDGAKVATIEGNFVCENEKDLIDGMYSGYLERVLEEQDDFNGRVSPVHGHVHDVSDECAFKDDELLEDKAVTEAVFSCKSSRNISWDGGNARTSHHFDQVEANADEVRSEKKISSKEPVNHLVVMLAENRKYREIPVNQHHIQINCCVTEREVEENKGFVREEGFVEHEEADGLFKSICEPAFDYVEACKEDGEICGVLQYDGNAIPKNVMEYTGFNSKMNDGTIEICQVDQEANEITGNVLDKYDKEHQVNLQLTLNKLMVEAEVSIETTGDQCKISELGKQKKDGADASVEELGKEGGGEAATMMAKESEFPETSEISDYRSICGAPLVSQESETNVAAILENCVCDNKKGLAEEGKVPGSLKQVVPKELVDLKGGPSLEHGHENAVSGEIIVERNRSLEEKATMKENFDCKVGKSVADSEDIARSSPQIELLEPFDHGDQREREIQKFNELVKGLDLLEEARKLVSDNIIFQGLTPNEQYNPLDNERYKEISVSQHSAPIHSFLVEDSKCFNYGGDLDEYKDSDGFVNTTDEPSLYHLPPKNRDSDETYDIVEEDGSGICENALGDRDIKDTECNEETNDTCQVIPDVDEKAAVNAAEKYLIHQVVKKADHDIKVVKEAENNNMREYTATAEAECWHKDSELPNENENAERCVSKVENMIEVPQASEESSKLTVSEYESYMEAKNCQIEKGVCLIDPEDEVKKGNEVMYDPEPNGLDEEFSVLQQTHEIVQAEMLTIKGFLERNMGDQSNLNSTDSILSSRESQEILRETVVSDLEDVEEASGATATIHSIKINFGCVDLIEDDQLMENLELESLGEFSQAKGKDHVVEENVEAMEQGSESKCAEWTMEDKLEARSSGAVEEVKANVEALSINFDGCNDEQAASVCAILDELISKEAEQQWKATIGSKLDREVIEVEAVDAAEGNANTSSQVSPQELVDHKAYDDKAPDAFSVAATLKDLSAECNEIAENNLNGQTMEGNFVCMDPENVVLEEENSLFLGETSSDTHGHLCKNQFLLEVNGSSTVLDEPVCGDNAAENFGGDIENVDALQQVFPANHCTNEGHIIEQVSGVNNCDDAALDNAICDYSRAEKKKTEADLEDSTKIEKFSGSSLKTIIASGSSVGNSLYQEDKDAYLVCYNNRTCEPLLEDHCKSTSGKRISSFSSIDMAEDRGHDELKGCKGDNVDFPLLPVDHAEDEGGNNNTSNTNSTDQENWDMATSLRELFAVEKAGTCEPMPNTVGKKDMKEANMDDINSLLRKMHISSALKWRGLRTSMTPNAPKKLLEDQKHNLPAFDMKENIMSMKNEQSSNCLVERSAKKRRALEDLQKSQNRDHDWLHLFKQ